MEFDEEFSGTPVEGTGEEALIQSAPINKGPKPKREKKEPGEELSQRFLCVSVRERERMFLYKVSLRFF